MNRHLPRRSRSPTSAGSTPGPAPNSSTSPSGLTAKIEVEKDGNKVVGTSIMGLMMLGAAMGDSITIHCEGDGCDEAMAELAALVEGRFGEE